MKELYADVSFQLIFDEKCKLMLQVWSSYSTSLMETEIKERLQFFFEEALNLKPNYLLIYLK